MSSSFKTILFFVMMLHIAFLGYLGTRKTDPKISLEPSKVLVKTVHLNPPKKTEAKKIVQAPKPKKVITKPKPKKIVQAPKPKPKKAPAKSKKPSEKKLSSEQIAKLQKAKDTLAKINLKAPAKPSNKTAKCEIQHLTTASTESQYSSQLSKSLQSLLILPEYGAVKIKLTLKRNGDVKNLNFVNSESKVNQKAIEMALKKAKFSSFGSHFSGESEHTFVIVLSNDL